MKKISSTRIKNSQPQKSGINDFDVPALVRAARHAVRDAVRQRKRAGHSIAALVNGKVTTIPASRIKLSGR